MLRFGQNNEVISEETYRAILIGVQLREDITYSMEELSNLAEAANIEVIAEVVQQLETPNKTSMIGKGKVEEIKEMIQNMEADIVIFNDELSGIQLRNLEDEFGIRTIDRTILILDIFSKRAISKVGKLQVELAQLRYRMPRLVGFGKSLSRLGGGIGTRGPGEKKLETDRRHIEKSMLDIRREIEQERKNRAIQRQKREKNGIPVVALVGYTNAGKSSIMNRILSIAQKEEKSVFEKNMLFATLDTHQRSISIGKDREFILVDTVGFVSKLPHSLIEAFKATLEEVIYADLIVHIVDYSQDNFEFQLKVTEKVLRDLGVEQKNKVIVYNKIDLFDDERKYKYISYLSNDDDKNNKNLGYNASDPCEDDESRQEYAKALYVSAKDNTNIDEMIEAIISSIFDAKVQCSLLIPYERGDISSTICERFEIIEMKYIEQGTLFTVELGEEDHNKYKLYEVKEN